MKRTLWLGFLMLLMLPAAANAQSPFDGTWNADPSTAQIQAKPEVYLLKDGRYDCPTCDPPHLKADGKDQTISGDPCYDTVNLKVVDDRTVEETYKKNGAAVETSKMTVSPDGNTATIDSSERCNEKADLIAIKYIMTRVGPVPPGAHAISGSWRLIKRVKVSDNAFTATLKLEGDTFSFSDPSGQGYTAKLNGTEASWSGTLGNDGVSVRRIAENTIEETDKEKEKVVEVVTYTVSASGKTMIITIENKVTGSVTKYNAVKQ